MEGPFPEKPLYYLGWVVKRGCLHDEDGGVEGGTHTLHQGNMFIVYVYQISLDKTNKGGCSTSLIQWGGGGPASSYDIYVIFLCHQVRYWRYFKQSNKKRRFCISLDLCPIREGSQILSLWCGVMIQWYSYKNIYSLKF